MCVCACECKSALLDGLPVGGLSERGAPQWQECLASALLAGTLTIYMIIY